MEGDPSHGSPAPTVRWLADEMLGRLARYLRFLGYDTEYVRGTDDDQIAERAIRENRTLLTRDRSLAARVPGALYVPSVILADQLRAVRSAHPEQPYAPRFDRCTRCNGDLRADRPAPDLPATRELPPSLLESEKPLFRCARCGHWYWEGSHTDNVRGFLREVWGDSSA